LEKGAKKLLQKTLKRKSQAMKYSTGRGTRTKHSTAMDWDEFEGKVKKRSRLRHSTGEKAAIRHACGIELDLKAEDMEDAIEAKKREIAKKNREASDNFQESFKKVSFDY